MYLEKLNLLAQCLNINYLGERDNNFNRKLSLLQQLTN